MARLAYRGAKRARTTYKQVVGPTRRWGKTGGQRRKAPAPRGKFAKAVKKVILSSAERCFKSYQQDGFTMQHDTLREVYIWSNSGTVVNTIFPSQGNSDSDRRGDEIYAQGITMRCVLQIPYDRRNVKIKAWFVQYNATQGDPADKTQFFHSICNNTHIDPRNSDRFPNAKYLGTFKCSAADCIMTGDKTIMLTKYLPFSKKLHFKIDAGNMPTNVNDRGSIIWAAYDTVTSSILDTVVTNAECCFTLHYRDP